MPIQQRNYPSNPLNNTKTFNENDKTKTIEYCRGAQCASALQRNNPKNTGITLIALIITIIILLILAGVTINFVLGENGILNKAKYASEKYTNAQIEENTGLEDIDNKMDNIIQGGNFRWRFRRKQTSYIRWNME